MPEWKDESIFVKTDPTAAAEKWSRKLAASSQDYVAGIRAVSTAPGVAAAAQANVAQERYAEAISSGRWARKVSAVSLATWQDQAANVGAPRLASGATKGMPKVQAFMADFLPFEKSVVDSVKQRMPRGNTEQNIQRAVAVMQGLSAYKNRGR